MNTDVLIGGVAVVYVMVALDHATSGNLGFATTWAAYAVANIGLLLAARGV